MVESPFEVLGHRFIHGFHHLFRNVSKAYSFKIKNVGPILDLTWDHASAQYKMQKECCHPDYKVHVFPCFWQLNYVANKDWPKRFISLVAINNAFIQCFNILFNYWNSQWKGGSYEFVMKYNILISFLVLILIPFKVSQHQHILIIIPTKSI